jgi:hypothetical protein
MGMPDVLNLFNSLPLDQQTAIYPQITAAFNDSKDARRIHLEAEIRALGRAFGHSALARAIGVFHFHTANPQRLAACSLFGGEA